MNTVKEELKLHESGDEYDESNDGLHLGTTFLNYYFDFNNVSYALVTHYYIHNIHVFWRIITYTIDLLI